MAETVVVVGGGGREHAIVRALARSNHRPRIVCAPGNAGIARDAECRPVETADPAGVARLARDADADLVVIGPEAPLVAGVADAVRGEGIPTMGPGAAAARLEGSKAFSKDVMNAAGVPTARSITVTTVADGLNAIAELGMPVAVKADGLAAGKGVVVAHDPDTARAAREACLTEGAFGEAGRTVVVEEGLVGNEVSLLAVCADGIVSRFPAARDYKPIGEGNTGPNTGGMGSVSPIPDIPDELADRLVDEVHRPVIAELADRGIPFNGVLYAGLMMTADGPRVLEFNTRFGDPETQALLPRLEDDAYDLMQAIATGTLEDRPVRVSDDACVAVVLAANGYPATPRGGDVIHGLEAAEATGAEIFHAGTSVDDAARIVTSGGRVLAVARRGATVDAARQAAYESASHIGWEGMIMRRDIARGL